MAFVVISFACQIRPRPFPSRALSFYPWLSRAAGGDFPARHVPRVRAMFEHLIEQQNVLFAAWRRFGVYLFEGPISIGDIDRIEMSGSQFFRKSPGKIVEIAVIFPSDSRMSSEERAHWGKTLKRWGSRRLATATVILATDLVGSMQRSVLTGLQLITRPPHPTKVFPKIDEAILWLAPYITEACGIDATYPKVMDGIHDATTRFASRAEKAPVSSQVTT